MQWNEYHSSLAFPYHRLIAMEFDLAIKFVASSNIDSYRKERPVQFLRLPLTFLVIYQFRLMQACLHADFCAGTSSVPVPGTERDRYEQFHFTFIVF